MAKFTIKINEQKKRRRLFYGYFLLGLGILSSLFYLFSKVDESNWRRFGHFIIPINLIITGIDRIRSTKIPLFVDLNANGIEWQVQRISPIVITVEWNDIRWIKKEKDESISFYVESSFSSNLRLKEFAEEDRIEIMKLLYELATQKQIRLINFSEPALAFA